MKNLLIKLSWILFVCPIALHAQKSSSQEKPKANTIARSRFNGDSIVLRWAVTNELAWKLAQNSGYIIERAELGDKKAPYVKITPNPIKPISQEELTKKYLSGKDHYTGVALATLYGNTAVKESDFTISNALEMSRMFRMRYAYNLLAADLSANAANSSALRWVDKDIKPGKTYGYRIYSPINPSDCILDTAYVFVDTRYNDTLPQIPQLRGNPGDGKIELLWDFLRTDFSAWNIERSDNLGKTWVQLNVNPYLVVEGENGGGGFIITGRFADTGLINYKKYRYRINAVTPFAEAIKTDAFFEINPKDLTPPSSAVITKITQGVGSEMLMEWSHDNKRKDLKGFKIGKAETMEGPFFEIGELLPPNTRKFKDPSPDEAFGNYYVVYSIDTAGNVSISDVKTGFIKDNRPPETPKILKALMDTSGVVTITWQKSKAPDIQGYRLYTANDSTHEFGLVKGTLITDSFYFDSLTVWTLSRYRFYRIAAIDLSFNISPLSKVIPVRRPDLIPPVPPYIISATKGEKGLEISVSASTSDDVKIYYLEMAETGTKNKSKIPFYTKGGETFNYIDTTSKPGKSYELIAYAIDSSGNRSGNSPLVYAQIPMSNAGLITAFKANLNSEKKQVELNWNLNGKADQVMIYKSNAAGELEWYKDVKANKNSFEDLDIKSGTYDYALKVVGSNFTLFSKIVSISIP